MKKLKKQIKGMVGTGMLLGVGAQAVHSVGGNTAGLTAVSGHMPTLGNVVGAGGVMRQMKKLKVK